MDFIFGPLPLAMQSAFAVLALYWAARGGRADLDESRRLLRGLFLAVVGALSVGINVTELYLLGAPAAARAPFDNVVTLAMAVGYVVVLLTVFRFDSRVLERLLERTSPLRNPNCAMRVRNLPTRRRRTCRSSPLHSTSVISRSRRSTRRSATRSGARRPSIDAST